MTPPVGIGRRVRGWLLRTGWLPAWLHKQWEAAATEELLAAIFGPRCSDA